MKNPVYVCHDLAGFPVARPSSPSAAFYGGGRRGARKRSPARPLRGLLRRMRVLFLSLRPFTVWLLPSIFPRLPHLFPSFQRPQRACSRYFFRKAPEEIAGSFSFPSSYPQYLVTSNRNSITPKTIITKISSPFRTCQRPITTPSLSPTDHLLTPPLTKSK